MIKYSLLLFLFLSAVAHASSDEPFASQKNRAIFTSSLNAAESYSRAEAVLQHFGVPAEGDSSDFLSVVQDRATSVWIRSVLPYFDKEGAFAVSYLHMDDTAASVFQDEAADQVLDYSVGLSGKNTALENFQAHIVAAANNPSAQPLLGLRIALDPGHMGGDFWDVQTGKFIKDAQGRKLSEGVMNLQICLLLEQELKKLGAEVFITHRTLAPVSQLPYQTYDLKPFALAELRSNSAADWFVKLLETAPAGDTLFNAFSSSTDFQKIFSERERGSYFILGADLDARRDAITAFQPDITLVIHLDVSVSNANPHGLSAGFDGTKAYVLGGFFHDEFATREDRKYFGRKLFDPSDWNASLSLGRDIVHNIHDRLSVPLDPGSDPNSVVVEPGIYARNLFLSRELVGQVVSYVECLFYNDPKEFAALVDATHPMDIGGVNVPYSDRIASIADALSAGVQQFVKEYKP